MICGPKSSGKSTFAKLLVNRLLSVASEGVKGVKSLKNLGVGLLDLDPGQPEYSPPGQLSLVHVQEPNFGPPFTHPVPSPNSNILRSHSLGAISPSMDPDLYMSCALDLFAHYRNLLSKSPNCPLVINTPGWVLGTGLEILVDLIAKIRPTEVIYMSKDGPLEVIEALGEVNAQIPVLTLPSQASEYTTKTAAHLRTMQYMSYFHQGQPDQKGLAWNTQPLTSMPPWEIPYSGEHPGILGVMCYGEQPPASLVADTINGSLVAVVVIDDMTAIPGCGPEGQNESNDEEMQLEEKGLEANIAGIQPLVQPLILHTPEKIPYFNPSNAISLNPKNSHSIGLALVRSIDIDRRRIQILTPISPSTIEEINKAGKSIILVTGKLDTPGWAYIEELTQKIALEKLDRNNESTRVEVDDDDEDGEDADSVVDGNSKKASSSLDDGFKNAPWIERLEGSQGRGIGSRVWRVRRDLGRDGGD
jgi:polynucleotide 5'-hydroxyl-kinase GRC3/NOL9